MAYLKRHDTGENLMEYSLKCLNCENIFVSKGEPDVQDGRDGEGAYETGGVELEETCCPECFSEDIKILDEIFPDFDL